VESSKKSKGEKKKALTALYFECLWEQ